MPRNFGLAASHLRVGANALGLCPTSMGQGATAAMAIGPRDREPPYQQGARTARAVGPLMVLKHAWTFQALALVISRAPVLIIADPEKRRNREPRRTCAHRSRAPTDLAVLTQSHKRSASIQRTKVPARAFTMVPARRPSPCPRGSVA